MLLKLNYLQKNMKIFYFSKFIKNVYKNSLYSEFFYKLKLKYLDCFLSRYFYYSFSRFIFYLNIYI